MNNTQAQIPTTLPQTIPDSNIVQGDSSNAAFLPPDSTKGGIDQAYIDSLKATSDLQEQVQYQAEDSIIFDMRNGFLYMYHDSKLNYTDIELEAERVDIELDKQTLHAKGITDSLGNELGLPKFTMEGEQYESKSLSYNFKSQKGRVTGGRAVQDDGFILTDVAKYQPDGSLFGKDGKYTTCDHPEPHYYIRSRKMKLTASKQVISGPLNLVIADLPIPIIVPFAFIPDQPEGEVDGILRPEYGNAQDRGYFLRKLGYYKAINEYFDIKVDGDIYSKGGWRLGLASGYKINHRFSGNLGFSFGRQRFNEPSDPDYRETSAWNLNWSHRQPINPNTNINSSVQIASSNSFNRDLSYNRSDFFQNNLNSSISFQKKITNTPFNLNMSLRHQQDLNKETMSMSLPEMNLSMARQQPFKNISNKKLDFLRQFGINYSMNARNRIESLPDSLFLPVLLNPRESVLYANIESGDTVFTQRRNASFYKNGMQHTASAATTIKLLNYINISPNFNYEEIWYTESIDRSWDPTTQSIDTDTFRGFHRAYEFRTSVSASTNFYGIYGLKYSKKEVKFRQRFSPTVSYNLKPDFADPRWGFYREVQKDTAGGTALYSIFENGIYGSPSRTESQSLGFGLSSVLEMKYRSKESFDPEFDEKQDKFERIRVIDNLSLSSSYNFAVDSFNLSPFSMRARTNFLDNKLNLNASATLDPYAIVENSDGNLVRVSQYMWDTEGRLGRFTRAQISLSTSLRAKPSREKNVNPEEVDATELAGIQAHSYQYVDFDIPWDVRLRYSLSYTNSGTSDPRVVSTLNMDGSVTLTENWKVNFSSGFDLVEKEVTNTSIQIFRNLHCWDMSFRWVPFGPQKSYSLSINVRSATLQALRLQKNDYWQDRFN